MRLRVALALGVLALCVPAADAALGPARPVAPTHGTAFPQLATDAGGSLYLAHGGLRPGVGPQPPTGVLLRRSPQGAWGAPVYHGSTTSSRIIRLAAGPAGRAVGVEPPCSQGGCSTSVALTGSDGSWQPALSPLPLVAPASDLTDVAVDPAGTATVVLSERFDDRHRAVRVFRQPLGGAWSAGEDISGQGDNYGARVGAGADGSVVVSWIAYDGVCWCIKARRLHQGTWGPVENVASCGAGCDPPNGARVVTGPDGVPTVVWSTRASSVVIGDVFAARRNPATGTWTTQKLNPTGQGGSLRSVSADSTGVTVAWGETGSLTLPENSGYVGVARFSGGAWQPAQIFEAHGWVGPGQDGRLNVAMATGPDGTGALLYNDRSDALVLRKRVAGVWGAPTVLSVRTHGLGFLHTVDAVTVDAAGRATVAFTGRAVLAFYVCVQSEVDGPGGAGPPICTGVPTPGDGDHDGVPDASDRCPSWPDPNQENVCGSSQSLFGGPCPPGLDRFPPGPCNASDQGSAGGGTKGKSQFHTGPLGPRGAAARIGRILRAGGFTTRVIAPTAGTATLEWKTRKARRMIVARGRRTFQAGGSAKVKLKLTKAGRRVLRRTPRRLPLTATALWRPFSSKQVAHTASITLRR
jgi:hypothetical protein